MINFIFGLSIGAFFGYLLAVLFITGKKGDRS